MNKKTNIFHIRIISYLLEHGSFRYKKEVMDKGETNTAPYTEAIEDLIGLREIKRSEKGIEFSDIWKKKIEDSPNVKKILLQNKDKLSKILKGENLEDSDKAKFEIASRISKVMDITPLKNKQVLKETIKANDQAFQPLRDALKETNEERISKETTSKIKKKIHDL